MRESTRESESLVDKLDAGGVGEECVSVEFGGLYGSVGVPATGVVLLSIVLWSRIVEGAREFGCVYRGALDGEDTWEHRGVLQNGIEERSQSRWFHIRDSVDGSTPTGVGLVH